MRLFTFFPNLITKESYNWWITRRFWGFKQQISKAKYLKIFQNIDGKYQEASGEHRSTVQNGCSPIRVDVIRWSRYIRPEKLKRPPLPSGCEIFGCKMSAHEILPRVDWAMLRKGDRLHVQGVGTLLPDDTKRAWLSGFPKRKDGAMTSGAAPSGW